MVKEMVEVKARADKERLNFTMLTKAQLNKLEQQIKKLTQELDKAVDNGMKLD